MQFSAYSFRADNVRPGNTNPETISESIKLLKPQLLVKIITAHKMDQAIIFVRTKVDCDNLEEFLNSMGGGKRGMCLFRFSVC